MKRYLLFGGEIYYPRGGWNDLHGNADSIQELKDLPVAPFIDWMHIVDLHEGKIVHWWCKDERSDIAAWYDEEPEDFPV